MIREITRNAAQLLEALCRATDKDKIEAALSFSIGAFVYIREELQREREQAKKYRVAEITILLTPNEEEDKITYTLVGNPRAIFTGNLLVATKI